MNMIFIIKYFSFIMLSLTKYLYKEQLFIQIIVCIIDVNWNWSIIILNIKFKIIAISTFVDIIYNFDIRTFLIIFLYLIENQWIIFLWKRKISLIGEDLLINKIIYSIWLLKSLLFINNLLMKTKNFVILRLTKMNLIL